MGKQKLVQIGSTPCDKYGRGSAAANGPGFADLAPGDTFDGLEAQLRARISEVYVNQIRFIRVFSPFVFADRRLLATITLKEKTQGGNFYSVEAVGITKDACSERTPRGAMSEDLNAAPFLEHAPLLHEIISYYVGDINRTRPEFIGLPEPFTIQAAVSRLLVILEDRQQDVPNLCPTVPALAKDTRLHLIRCEEIPYEQGK